MHSYVETHKDAANANGKCIHYGADVCRCGVGRGVVCRAAESGIVFLLFYSLAGWSLYRFSLV